MGCSVNALGIYETLVKDEHVLEASIFLVYFLQFFLALFVLTRKLSICICLRAPRT
jgi:hypothetical protein